MVTAVMPTYGRIDIAFDDGEGPYHYTAAGERYLDYATGIATNSLGHAHPHLVKKLQEQAVVIEVLMIRQQLRLLSGLLIMLLVKTIE